MNINTFLKKIVKYFFQNLWSNAENSPRNELPIIFENLRLTIAKFEKIKI